MTQPPGAPPSASCGAPLQDAEDLGGDLDGRDGPRAAVHEELHDRARLVEAVDAAVLRPDVARAATHEPLHGEDGVERSLRRAALRPRAHLRVVPRAVVDRGREERGAPRRPRAPAGGSARRRGRRGSSWCRNTIPIARGMRGSSGSGGGGVALGVRHDVVVVARAGEAPRDLHRELREPVIVLEQAPDLRRERLEPVAGGAPDPRGAPRRRGRRARGRAPRATRAAPRGTRGRRTSCPPRTRRSRRASGGRRRGAASPSGTGRRR